MASGRRVWRRFWKYLRPYWGQQALIFVCLLAGIALRMIFPFGLRHLVDKVVVLKNTPLLLPVMGMLVTVVILQGVLAVVRDLLFTYVGQHLLYDLRREVIRYLHRLPISFFDRVDTGEVLSRVWNDIDVLTEITSGALPRLVTQIITFMVTLAMLFLFEWRLGLIAFCGLPLFLVSFGFWNKQLSGRARTVRETVGACLAHLQEDIAGIRTIRAFNIGRYRYLKFVRMLKRLLKNNILLQLYSSLTIQGAGIVVLGWPLVALGYGALLFIRGATTLGTMLAAWFLTTQLFSPLAELSNLNVSFQKSTAALIRIFDLLDQPLEEHRKGKGFRPFYLRGEVVFDHVSFSYPDGRPVLKDVSFCLPAGSFTALVGPSGAGKSTIVNLLLGFYRPDEGKIYLDGIPLTTYDLHFLRQRLMVVPQEVVLFHGTISENITLGSHRLGPEKIALAAKLAGVEEFAKELPQGYETIVGGNSPGLSGGQRQRIGIARALIRDPIILILDEAIASLDSRSEMLIQQSLDKIRGKCTILIIAHRLSTVLHAERIILLDGGRVVDVGNHAELWERQTLYRELFKRQLREEGLKEGVSSLAPERG